jgi:hypothetical protein
MKKHVLMLTTSAFILACSAMATTAQQSPGMPMMQKSDQAQQPPADRDGGQGGMTGRGMMGREGMMGCGMMGHGGMNSMPMRIIFALMDGDGDGTVSLQEFQAAHEKIFKAMDTDKDGTLTLEEIQAFMRGTSKSPLKEHEHE